MVRAVGKSDAALISFLKQFDSGTFGLGNRRNRGLSLVILCDDKNL